MGDHIATFLTILTACAGLGAIADKVFFRHESVDLAMVNTWTRPVFRQFLQKIGGYLDGFLRGGIIAATLKVLFFSVSLVFLVHVLKAGGYKAALQDIAIRDVSPLSLIVMCMLAVLCISITVAQTRIFLGFAERSNGAAALGVALLADVFIAAHLFSIVTSAFFFLIGSTTAYFLPQRLVDLDGEKYIEFQVSKEKSYQDYYRYEVSAWTRLDKGNFRDSPFINIQYLSQSEVPAPFDIASYTSEFHGREYILSATTSEEIGDISEFAEISEGSVVIRFGMGSSDVLAPHDLLIEEAYANIDGLRDNMFEAMFSEPRWQTLLTVGGAGLAGRYGNFYRDFGCISTGERAEIYRRSSTNQSELREFCESEVIIELSGVITSSITRKAFWNNFFINDFPVSSFFSATVFVSLGLYLFVIIFFGVKFCGFLVIKSERATSAFGRAPGTIVGVFVGVLLGATAFA